MKSKRSIFIFMNFPTGSNPYVDAVYKATPYLESMYASSKGQFLSKRDLERAGIWFPAGPRYKMFHYELPESFDTFSPSGPDIIDIAHERFLQHAKETKEAKEKSELK